MIFGELSSFLRSWAHRSALPSIAEDTILATLRERFLSLNPYTSLSSTALVSVNPHKYLSINGDASLQDYVAEYYKSAVDDEVLREERGSGLAKERLNPHIFRLALGAYYNMKRTKQDQIVVLKWVNSLKYGLGWW